MTFARAIAILLLPACPAGLMARVTRVVIEERQSSAYEGRSFGSAGAYERLSGHFFGELDPKDPLNAIITDIELAPRNARGLVEYSATFTLHKPVDMARASGVMIYDVPNRGNRLLFLAFHRGPEPGDGFLFERGHVILASGWQGDVIPKAGMQSLSAPIARNADGSAVTGPVLARFSDLPAGTRSVPLRTYPAASLDPGKATLTRRASDSGAVIPIGSGDWAFADCTAAPFPGVSNPAMLCLRNGFNPLELYELVYTAKDPIVLGIGLAATRDIVSFFRRELRDDTGEPNPVAGRITHAIGQGISQSGNFVKTFLHLGFNQDEKHRIVWDGANDHIAGRQTPLNLRFGVPGGMVALYEPGSEAVLWWNDYLDSARGRVEAGMLDRCRAVKVCPKIFETFGSAEFWGLKMSPALVGTRADADIPLPPEVRRYYFPGTTHGGGRGGFRRDQQPSGRCELPDNPNPQTETMRALLDDLVDWVVRGTEPPPSRYPQLQSKDLVRPEHRAMGFPLIPGRPLPDNMLNTFFEYDFGPGLRYNDMSGVVSIQPPVIVREIPALVPKVDADGNETSGVPSVQHQAPLGTYIGWNVTGSGYHKGRACGFAGGFIPFANTKAERAATGDPRQSIEERYASREAYVAAVRAAAERLVAERFLLKADAERLVREAAEQFGVLR